MHEPVTRGRGGDLDWRNIMEKLLRLVRKQPEHLGLDFLFAGWQLFYTILLKGRPLTAYG